MIDRADERLVQFINEQVSLSPDPVDVDTDLLLSGTVDSLGVILITRWIEDEFGIEVDPLDVTLENFQTVRRMSAYLDRQRAGS